MRKTNSYFNFGTVIYYLFSLAFMIIWLFNREELSLLLFALTWSILANIEMAITTIKKYIDSKFEEVLERENN